MKDGPHADFMAMRQHGFVRVATSTSGLSFTRSNDFNTLQVENVGSQIALASQFT
jgi:hypothetical protein